MAFYIQTGSPCPLEKKTKKTYTPVSHIRPGRYF